VQSDHQLSTVLGEFARTMVTDFPIQSILDHLVLRIVDVLPITAAGVTLITPGAHPRYVAASDDSAMTYEQLQSELGEGPCLAAFETGAPVAIPDLRLDTRFPGFAERALEEGLVAVFTFPLRHGSDQLGALDLYRTTPGPLDAGDTEAAQTLADVCAAYLQNAKTRDELGEASARLRESTLHDALTGLPNRTLFVHRLEHAILRARRSQKLVAVLFTDLDRFKSVNDTYGHHVGDELLAAVAARISGLLRPGDTLARLGGDEFIVLCEDLDEESQVGVIADRVGKAFSAPFALTTVDIQVSASVGIAFSGPAENVPAQLIQNADTAMYHAKRRGGDGHGIFDLRDQYLSDRRADLQRRLGAAQARQELRVEYQPIVSTVEGHVVGVEALLRWEHPTLGTIGPTTIIPLAEKSGVITDIGRWVLERACLDRRGLARHNSGRPLSVSVNVSVRQLMGPDFAAVTAAVLRDTETDPSLVSLEVTESVFIHDNVRALIVLKDLKRLGVNIALDDFGTGYSSLSYLRQFPVDVLKMDRAFISDLDRDNTSRLIVNSVVDLAHGLNMQVVAEGVESPEQYAQVLALDCDSYQGFHFGRPRPREETELVLAQSA
jgi:diguanylate cyclase (GGDEF)-like protein